MRTIQVHPLSIACGVIVTAAVVLLSAQTTPPAQTTWPPPKSMILNVFEQNSQSIQIAANSTFTVLTVPADRWLTVTGCSAVGASTLTWAELTSGGTLTKKGLVNSNINGGYDVSGGPQLGCPEASPSNCGGPLGWTFAPGSSVVLLNPLSSGSLSLGTYAMVGYYSRN